MSRGSGGLPASCLGLVEQLHSSRRGRIERFQSASSDSDPSSFIGAISSSSTSSNEKLESSPEAEPCEGEYDSPSLSKSLQC